MLKELVAAPLRERLVLDESGCDKTELVSEICELGLSCHIRIRKGSVDTCQILVIRKIPLPAGIFFKDSSLKLRVIESLVLRNGCPRLLRSTVHIPQKYATLLRVGETARIGKIFELDEEVKNSPVRPENEDASLDVGPGISPKARGSASMASAVEGGWDGVELTEDGANRGDGESEVPKNGTEIDE